MFFAFKPKRSAHPTVKFKCEPSEPLIFEEIPFDKYELEPSPLTQFILERRQPNVAWQVFIRFMHLTAYNLINKIRIEFKSALFRIAVQNQTTLVHHSRI